MSEKSCPACGDPTEAVFCSRACAEGFYEMRQKAEHIPIPDPCKRCRGTKIAGGRKLESGDTDGDADG